MSTAESEVVGPEPSLASILSGSKEPVSEKSEAPAEAPKSETVTPANKPETAERPRGEDGKFLAKEPTPAEAPPPKTDEPPAVRPQVDVAALIAERRKRQAAERAAAQAPAQKTDFFENPDRAIDERLTEREGKLEARLFNLSMKAARAGHADYDTAARAFTEAANRDPRLVDALQADDDPGELVYTLGKHILELADVGGDIGRYKQKVIEASKAELAAKDQEIQTLKTQVAELQKQYNDLSTVRGSLATRTSAASSSSQATDEEDTKSIVRFNSRKQ